MELAGLVKTLSSSRLLCVTIQFDILVCMHTGKTRANAAVFMPPLHFRGS